MSFYGGAQATVARMLAKYGEAAAIRRVTVSGGGPSDPDGGSASQVDHPCRLAIFPIDQRDIDGTAIKAGDFRVLVDASGLGIEPVTTDTLVCSAGQLKIVDAGRFAPAGTVTHYRMVARK